MTSDHLLGWLCVGAITVGGLVAAIKIREWWATKLYDDVVYGGGGSE